METITTRVQQVFADLTRYPIEILDVDADLEMDLGIDSVKRGEIFAVLAQQFNLPPMSEMPAQQVWTINRIAKAIDDHTGQNGARQTPAAAGHPVPPTPPINNGRTQDEMGAVRTTESSSNGAASISKERVPIADAVGTLEPRVLRALQSLIQEALDRSEQAQPIPSANLTSPGLSTKFLPATHRPFAGKVALVTGSGRGLGKAIANQLADLGASVIVNSFHSRERGEQVTAEITARGGDAIHLWGSVANPKQLTQIFEEIDQRYGGLDFFVQNASNGLIAPIDQITDVHWDKAFRTNVVSLHQGALLSVPLMKRRGGGKIVTISSPGAHNHIEHFGCIGPVKAAVESLIVYLAVELGPHNIQVNALSAGPLYGELMDSYPDSKRLVQHWETRAPDHRLGDAREISNAVMFLLSDLADKTSGAVLLVDGASSRRL
ncbi:MAG: SDR family oxidoreductase [Hyphomicrobiales bacterium]|nr:SDR family oxidoreductase [Hyphomicrobiales bacterium]